MASCTRNARFELRRNQSTIWTQNNPTLLSGEPGVELDTGQMKVGDGIRTWNLLPYVGTGGAGSTGPLIFTPSQSNGNDQRILTGYFENSTVKKVRDAYFSGSAGSQQLVLVLASFNPVILAAFNESRLSWDQPCSGFNVTVTNPIDYTSQFISSVHNISASVGSISPLNTFSAGSKSDNPAAGIRWTQVFTVQGLAYIYPGETTDYAEATVTYNINNGTVHQTASDKFRVYWNYPSISVPSKTLTGQTFLGSYTSTDYSVNIGGVNLSGGNFTVEVTGSLGNVTNSSGNGTINFSSPITYMNASTNIPEVNSSATFNRPANVTGTSDSVTLNAKGTINAQFTFPAFYTWTTELAVRPTTSDIINPITGFNSINLQGQPVRLHGSNSYSGQIFNPSPSVNQAFWFGVISTAPDIPTVFKSGDGFTYANNTQLIGRNTYTVDLSPPGALPGTVVYKIFGATYAGSDYPTHIQYY